MVSSIMCLYSIAILACFANGASAIKCYQCYSRPESNCLDLSGDSGNLTADCSNPYHGFNGAEGCLKMVINSEQPQVIRECYYGYESAVALGCYLEESNAKCHFCENDLCNSSTINVPIVAAVTFIFIVGQLMS